MIPTATPSTAGSAVGRPWSRRPSPTVVHRVLRSLGVIVALTGIALAGALIAGATAFFNVLVFALFTLLWVAFAVALAVSPETLHDVWRSIRTLPLLIQAVIWLLFLPVTAGLWIWERAWSVPVRLILVAALGVGNVLMFIPR
jgi:hypothetical protein